MKKRFAILGAMPAYPFATQVKLVVALSMLSNFIKIRGSNDDDIYNQEWIEEAAEYDEISEEEDGHGNAADERGGIVTDAEKRVAKEKRDSIAKAMWEDYEQVREHRR